jgi:archaellum biogenesis protein FlaJ (TadC family)
MVANKQQEMKKNIMIMVAISIAILCMVLAIMHPTAFLPTLVSLAFYEGMGLFIYNKFLC